MKIAFIGLGIMGSRMAGRLIGDNELAVFNRSPDKARALEQAGARSAASAAEAVADADVVITMLADPAAVRTLALDAGGFLEHMPADALWVDMSTGEPAFSRELDTAARRQGLRFVDAPVAGSRPQAETGELTIFAGGESGDVAQARPVLERLGSRVVHLGAAGQGMAMKMVVNHLLGTAMQAFAEGLRLGENQGLDQQTLLDILLNAPVTPPFLNMKRAKLESGDYDTDFSLKWMHKDMQMVARTAYDHTTPMPLSVAAQESYRMALQTGLGERDFAAIYHWLQSTPGS